MTERDESLDPIIDILREPVALRTDLTERVMSEIEDLSLYRDTAAAPVRWWRRQWTVRLTPLHGLVAAAGLAGLVLAVRLTAPKEAPGVPVAAQAGGTPTQFVLVAPGAASVSIVGDFNDWSTSATPLTRTVGDGVWSVTVPLGPGRYRYAFVVDGTTWRPDPVAPGADDEFGRSNSVETVGGS